MRILLRLYCVLFHFILGAFLFGIGMVTVSGGVNNLQLGMLPWTGGALTAGVIILGLLGMFLAVLALLGRLKILFPLWALFVVVMMVHGFFLSPYVFRGRTGFHDALLLTLGTLLAFLLSWTVFPKKIRS